MQVVITWLVPYSRGFILKFTALAYVTFPVLISVNIRYAYVYACAHAYVAV